MEEGKPPPPGLFPIFLTMTTQEKFNIVSGDHVTEEKPHATVNKAEVLQHIQMNGKISDWHCSKAVVEKYPEDDILIALDEENVYGQNFYLLVTLEAKERELAEWEAAHATAAGGGEGGEGGEGQQEEEDEGDDGGFRELEPPRPWESQGSEQEIDSLAVENTRSRLLVRVARRRKEFGSTVRFNDDAGLYEEYRPYRDKHFELVRSTRSTAVQAVPSASDARIQTRWHRKLNSSVQPAPVTLKEIGVEGDSILQTVDVDRAEEMRSAFELALQQNEAVDIMSNDLNALADEEAGLGSGLDAGVKEFQSFTDIQYSKAKIVSAVDWVPGQEGMIAVSCTSAMSFEERVENDGKVPIAHILIWSFQDPINPLLVLETPGDCFAFQFNPYNHNIVSAGNISGLVMTWDLSKAFGDLKRKDRRAQSTMSGMLRGGSVDQEEDKTAVVKPSQVSVIETSHKRMITDIKWLSAETEIALRGGRRVAKAEGDTTSNETHQFLSIAADGMVLFWDLRISKEDKAGAVLWNPIWRVVLSGVEGGGELAGSKLHIRDPDQGAHVIIGTQDGEVVLADWTVREVAAASGEEGDGAASGKGSAIMSWNRNHSAGIVALQTSPFVPGLILTVGDWTFCVQDIATREPLFTSPHASCRVTAGIWSPSRPGVIVIAKTDGSIEIWDLLDASHEPSMTANVASTSVTSLQFWSNPDRPRQQYLAAGDSYGTLHVLEIPANLRKELPAESQLLQTLFQREAQRVDYIRDRMQIRGTELVKMRQLEEEQAAAEEEARAAAEAAAEARTQALAQGGEPENSGQAEEEEAELDPDVAALEDEYKKLAAEVCKQLGIKPQSKSGDGESKAEEAK